MANYDEIYRRLNPRSCPLSPYERQRELGDLWPSKQSEFRKMIDCILYGQEKHDGQ